MAQREALCEWNQAAQLVHMRAAQSTPAGQLEREVYQPRFLIARPLLQALQTPAPGALLLIDEVDRADEPFEAFLPEYLGEHQVSIPELGPVQALVRPITILTSNRTRRILWLNPLLRFEGYAPLAQGPRILSRCCAAVLPMHNLNSLSALSHAVAQALQTP